MDSLKNDRRLLMDRSVAGRMGASLPHLDVPEQPLPSKELLREELDLPEVSEGEVVPIFHHPEPDELLRGHQLLSPGKLYYEVQPQDKR